MQRIGCSAVNAKSYGPDQYGHLRTNFASMQSTGMLSSPAAGTRSIAASAAGLI